LINTIKLFFIILVLFIFIFTINPNLVYADTSVWEVLLNTSDLYLDQYEFQSIDVASDGTIYLSDLHNGMIIQYNETGEKHIGEGVLIEPMGLTLSSDENFLYVVDNGENLLYLFNLEHGSFIVYNPTEDGVLDIGELTDVVSSLDEVIYITDYTSNCLRILNANKTWSSVWTLPGIGDISHPRALDINSQGGMIIATELGQAIFSSGSSWKATDTSGAEGGFVQTLTSVTIDDSNRIYLGDYATGRIVVLTNSGWKVISTLCLDADYNNTPSDICISGNYLYALVESENSQLIVRCTIENDLLNFSLQDSDAIVSIDNNKNSITIEVPHDTDLEALVPNIICSDGAVVSIISGKPYDFTNPATLSIESTISGIDSYTITINKAPKPVEPGTIEATEEITLPENSTISSDAVIVDSWSEFEILDDETQEDNDDIILIIAMIICFVMFMLWVMLIIVFRKKKLRILFIMLLIAQIVLGIIIIAASLFITADEEFPIYVENAELIEDDFDPYILSDDQKNIINTYGYPTGFTILYVGENGMDRQETWYYSKEGLVIDYFNGIKLSKAYDNSLKDFNVEPTYNYPEDFVRGMTPGTALSQADSNSFMIVPVEDAIVNEGTLYYGEGIILGFDETGLSYVETVLFGD